MFIFVLLFNAHTRNEGIYSCSDGTRNIILMFESGIGATYFASMLAESGFPQLTVELFHIEEIYQFCRSSGYDYKFVSADTVLIPPKKHAPRFQGYVSTPDTPQIVEISSIKSNPSQKSHYVETLRTTYHLYRRNIADIQLEKARRGFSVELNRQLEYYVDELQKVEREIQRCLPT